MGEGKTQKPSEVAFDDNMYEIKKIKVPFQMEMKDSETDTSENSSPPDTPHRNERTRKRRPKRKIRHSDANRTKQVKISLLTRPEQRTARLNVALDLSLNFSK